MGSFDAESLSALCCNLLPEESSWLRWLCGDNCSLLPAKASRGSASLRDSPRLAGTTVSVSHHKTPPAHSEEELLALISCIHHTWG